MRRCVIAPCLPLLIACLDCGQSSSPKEHADKTEQAQPSEAGGKGPGKDDPVGQLKGLLQKLQTQGTPERVTNFNDPDWNKRKMFASEIKYDVRRTDSLVSPYLADVTWHVTQYSTPNVPTKNEAEKAGLPMKPSPKPEGEVWSAQLAFQDGKWILKALGWKVPFLEIERKYPPCKS